MVLNFVRRSDTYGYEIVNEITKYYEINEKTVYPILHRLMKQGYLNSYTVKSPDGPSRKYYHITDEGQDKLANEIVEFKQFTSLINEVLKGYDEQ